MVTKPLTLTLNGRMSEWQEVPKEGPSMHANAVLV